MSKISKLGYALFYTLCYIAILYVNKNLQINHLGSILISSLLVVLLIDSIQTKFKDYPKEQFKKVQIMIILLGVLSLVAVSLI